MRKILALLFVSCFLFVGCATTSLSNLQRRSIEAKEFEGNFEDAFKATLQVLQDRGFIISHSDYQAGIIGGETGPKADFLYGSKNTKVSVAIEQFGEGRVKQRITFFGEQGDGVWVTKETRVIEDPKVLQEVYDEIQKEIFVRKNLSK